MGDANHPSHAMPVPGGRAGTRSRNPYGLAAPTSKARRTLAEALRGMMPDEEFGRVLLAIAAGSDPWARERKRNPDGVPTPVGGVEGIDWGVRMAALKMYAEYSRGKPVQGIVVQAEIDQRVAIEGRIETGPLDFRAMSAAQRSAFRTAALAALGKLPVIDVSSAPVGGNHARVVGESAARDASGSLDVERSATSDDGSAAATTGPRASSALIDADGGLDVERPTTSNDDGADSVNVSDHASTVDSEAADVKHDLEVERGGIYAEFRGSSNLVDARLVDGVCVVRFRASDGSVARTIRYRNVTPAMMTAWIDAPSAGAWFARQIRARHQQFPAIPDAAAAPQRGPVVV